jgi:uncharacterized protein
MTAATTNGQKPMGRVKGPGATAHTFTFLAPDPDQKLKIGEFISYQAALDDQERMIYGRIQQRQAVRLFPDDFASDPQLDPAMVAELVGYQQKGYPLYLLTVTALGYYDPTVGDFINPRIEPPAGQPVYGVGDADLSHILNKRQPDQVGAVHIGSLLSRGEGAVPIVLDGAALASTHLAVIANTGSGKSYLMSVIVEELLQAKNRAAIILIDPHSEYGTLQAVNQHPIFQTEDYRPRVTVYPPGKLKIAAGSLLLNDLLYLLPDLSERMIYLLQRAYRDVQRQSKREQGSAQRWTVAQLKARVRALGKSKQSDGEGDGDELKGYGRTAEALVWRLESVLEREAVFNDKFALALRQICQPGQAAILQLNEMTEREQQVLVATLLRRLFWARMQTEKGRFSTHHSLYLPYPVFVIVEEAHRFAPAAADVVSSAVLKEILGEGRKFGVAMALISQRPGKLDGDVISQCNTHCLLRIVNDLDQRRVAESVETVGRDLLAELPALTKGQAIVAGEAVSTPVLCQVRSRYTPHGAESKDAPADWQRYFSTNQ